MKRYFTEYLQDTSEYTIETDYAAIDRAVLDKLGYKTILEAVEADENLFWDTWVPMQIQLGLERAVAPDAGSEDFRAKTDKIAELIESLYK